MPFFNVENKNESIGYAMPIASILDWPGFLGINCAFLYRKRLPNKTFSWREFFLTATFLMTNLTNYTPTPKVILPPQKRFSFRFEFSSTAE